MRYIHLIFKAFFITGKLSFVLPRFYMMKKTAKQQFAVELRSLGLKSRDVKILTNAYADMISLNPGDYVSGRRA